MTTHRRKRTEQDEVNSEGAGRYGSPYDVGNYASHYDQRVDERPERIVSEQSNRYHQADHRGKGPRGYRRSDKRILEDISDRLYLDPYIDASELLIEVDHTEVILSGTVADRNAKRRAEEIAESIPGVRNVENRIRLTQTHIAGPVRSNAREELM